MKRYETIEEIVQFINRKHRGIRTTSGFYGYKFLRKSNGTRIPFEQVDGFRIFDLEAGQNSIRIDQMSSGFEYRGQKRVQQTCRLWLTDLAMINVYDYSAEFFSQSSIDFVYVEKTKDSEIQLLAEWIRNDLPVLRAQWVAKNDDVDRILDDLALGRKVRSLGQTPRMIDMDDDDGL